ncbi:MAG TPA: hypothetical protein VNK26_02465, partial [Pyrinomonadaceae bacterium]|nr:hypothetical protein [Pyrinomonadaceae bacterium]
MMNQFDAIRIEGGILSPDIFERLESNDLPGQRPQDFQVSQQRKLIDEIAEAYSDTLKYWTIFQTRLSKLPEKDTATSLTRDSLVIPFLGLLGYRLEYNKTAYKVGELTLSISHRAGDSEQAPPVHIVGIRQQLGRVPESGRPRLSPHALMQEYLNRSDALWGIVTNGSTLRLLRDSLNLRRQSYVEFDLESIFDGNHFQAFSILFRLLHRTRLPEGTDDADRCLLEQYYQHSIEQGSRIRDNLREGVEECIKQLANGLLSHPDNEELRKKLIESSGNDSLSPDEFYRQLLHLVYRFLFLLVSEERGLISNDLTYRDHYSISRLRRLQDSRVFRTEDDDLCCSLRVVWKLFSDEKLGEHLGVAPLNGELFAPIDIDQFLIHNKNLLAAIENLTYFKDSSGNRRRVNYAALDVEELGSVYESLLDLQPCITTKNGKLKFEFVGGTQRKSTGSYYTPQELVEQLVKNALEPVIKERLVSSERRVASGEASELTPEEKRYVYNFLSRPSGLAKRDEFG